MADVTTRAAALLRTTRQLIRSLESLSSELEADLDNLLDLGAGRAHALIDELRSENRQLREALEGRGIIERAKGMLMILHNCDEEYAFQMLVALSRQRQRKVREVAMEIASSTGAVRDLDGTGSG